MNKSFLNKTFGIRDGEIYISFLMQLYIFLIITVLLIVKPAVNALFLAELGASSLPYGYMIVAVVAVITTFYYNKWVKRFSLLNVTSISLTFFSASFILLAIILSKDYINSWLLYVYYVGVSLFAVITTSQFWLLANLVYDSREAKRLFGFIGSGAIAGGIFGGYLTSIIVSSFGNIAVIIVASILILSCIPILHKIWKLRIKKLNKYIRKQKKYDNSNSNRTAFSIVYKSKHLSYLALIIGFGVIVAKLVDYQFSDFAHRAILDSDDLASFFGFWFSSFNVIALCLQLFATNKVLSRFGVSTSLLILPLGIALGSLLFLTFPELWVLIIIKGIDGSFKQSINKAAIELSIMPIPFQIKNQAKSFIDVAVDSVATGFAGLLLILLVRRLELSTSYITVIILALTFIWILLIYKLREAYFNSFRLNIQRTLTTESISKGTKKENTIVQTRRILNSEDESQVLDALEHLSTYRIKALKSEIIRLLEHPSNKVKSMVINQLYRYDKGTALTKVKELTRSNDSQLVHNALIYILDHSNISKTDFFSSYLDNDNKKISSSALLCLARESRRNDKLQRKYRLEERIKARIKELEQEENQSRIYDISKLLITIAESGLSQFFPYINVYFNHKEPLVVKHAIKAAGISLEESFQQKLLSFLSVKEYRKSALKALRNYGDSLIKTIWKMEQREAFSNNDKKYIPKLISSFNNRESVKILMRFLKSRDIVIRLESAKSLIKLKTKSQNTAINKRLLKRLVVKECRYASDTLNALASLKQINIIYSKTENATDKDIELAIARESIILILDEQLDMSFECIFKLLSMLYDEADINVSYSGLRSNVKEARINALEFLDNLLQSQIKTEIVPIVEYYSLDETNLNNANLSLTILSEPQLIKLLIEKRGKRLKLEMLHIIRLLKDVSYSNLVNSLIKHKNNQVSSSAKETLKLLYN